MTEKQKDTHPYHEPPLRMWAQEADAIVELVKVMLDDYHDELLPIVATMIAEAIRTERLGDMGRHARATAQCLHLHEEKYHCPEAQEKLRTHEPALDSALWRTLRAN